MDEKKTKKLTLAEKAKRSAIQNKYIKEHYRRWQIKCHKTYESDLVAFLENKENVQAYIKELIRKDMENNQ